jgi:hypothetical protein
MKNGIHKKSISGIYDSYDKGKIPICGMDDMKFTYLLADLARRCGEYEISVKMLSEVMLSRKVGTALKNKARDLYDLLKEESKKNK